MRMVGAYRLADLPRLAPVKIPGISDMDNFSVRVGARCVHSFQPSIAVMASPTPVLVLKG